MSAAITVFLKEVTENLRDRKTVFNALVMGPLLGPVFFVMMMSFMITRELSNAEKPLEVPVVGAEHAPNLVGWLKQQGVQAGIVGQHLKKVAGGRVALKDAVNIFTQALKHG